MEAATTLDEESEKYADDANLALYVINMVVVSASDLPNTDMVGLTDPYCEVTIGGKDEDNNNGGGITEKTDVIENTLEPVWNKKMNFIVPYKPSKMFLQIKDRDAHKQDDDAGSAVFEFAKLFETGGEFNDDLELKMPKLKMPTSKKGTIRIRVKFRVLKPVETELKLNQALVQLKLKDEEHNALNASLDKCEELRKQANNDLSKRDQEIIEKDQALLEKTQEIETRIQEKEEAENARREAELKKEEAETILADAGKELVKNAEELKREEATNAAELSAKNKEIEELDDQLTEKEKAHGILQHRLAETEAIKLEVENDLKAKERIIEEQSAIIEQQAKEHEDELSKKEEEILAKSRELTEREEVAAKAQGQQDESTKTIQKLTMDLMKVEISRKEIEEKLSKAETRFKKAKEELDKYVGELEHLKKSRDTSGNDSEEYQDRLKEAEAAKAKIENEIKEKERIIREHDSKMQEMSFRHTTELTEREKAIVDMNKELTQQALGMVEELKKENARLEKQIVESQIQDVQGRSCIII